MTNELSEPDTKLLVYVASYIETNLQHHSPTSGEAADYLGYTRSNAIKKLNGLVAKGYLTRDDKGFNKWGISKQGKAWWLEYARKA